MRWLLERKDNSMSMIKRGTTKSKITVSSVIYVCGCGHTEMGKGKGRSKKCPKCGEMMDAVSSPELTGDQE